MDEPKRDEPEAEADDAGDLGLDPDQTESVKGGTSGGSSVGGGHLGPPAPGG
jgi:hypothetical protein